MSVLLAPTRANRSIEEVCSFGREASVAVGSSVGLVFLAPTRAYSDASLFGHLYFLVCARGCSWIGIPAGLSSLMAIRHIACVGNVQKCMGAGSFSVGRRGSNASIIGQFHCRVGMVQEPGGRVCSVGRTYSKV